MWKRFEKKNEMKKNVKKRFQMRNELKKKDLKKKRFGRQTI